MMLDVDVVNRKVIDNFHMSLVLQFDDFRPASLGVMNFTNSLTGLACVLGSAAMFYLFD